PYCAWWMASEGMQPAEAPHGDGAHGARKAPLDLDALEGVGSHGRRRDVAVLQMYTGLSAPVVLTHGSASGIAAILQGFIHELPRRAHVHMSPDHLAVLDQHFGIERLRPMVRMGLRASQLVASPGDQGPIPGFGPVERLSHRDTGDIIELSQHYPDSF